MAIPDHVPSSPMDGSGLRRLTSEVRAVILPVSSYTRLLDLRSVLGTKGIPPHPRWASAQRASMKTARQLIAAVGAFLSNPCIRILRIDPGNLRRQLQWTAILQVLQHIMRDGHRQIRTVLVERPWTTLNIRHHYSPISGVHTFHQTQEGIGKAMILFIGSFWGRRLPGFYCLDSAQQGLRNSHSHTSVAFAFMAADIDGLATSCNFVDGGSEAKMASKKVIGGLATFSPASSRSV
jgi:hypothetical protein